jgi:hypothetical protein
MKELTFSRSKVLDVEQMVASASIASKGIRNFINDQIGDASDGGEGLTDWFQDLF